MNETSKKTIIDVKGLNAFYGDRQILSDISLEITENEIMVIMGHSGSGKSTLLRHVLGLNRPVSGSIKILDQEITTLDHYALYELRKKIGVAFQNGAMFSSMNLLENVELPLHEHTRLDKNTIRIMARLKLELMDLGDNESLMPSELSGGMLKRAGLARAVVMDPNILFFDEPSAGLDPVTSAELDDLILQLRDAMNMTIVVVTHELESAFKIADRITVIDKGKQIMTGNKEEIKDSDDPRIINMLQRRAANETINADDYLNKLTRN
ncbi:MAG: ATP-binding cassette domain-containing protein [Proteobacteria bacterium]|nr:ATP-binding cassette domain-containing protein [Pseudomonadota bacterium]